LSVSFKSSFARINWDLHNALGFWMFLFVGMWAISGAYFVYPNLFSSISGLFGASTIARISVGDTALLWLANLHFGRFNLFSEIIWSIVGLVPALLAFTGVFMCCHRLLRGKPAGGPNL
jgi:uncharacterized iron-regulated membrane protein